MSGTAGLTTEGPCTDLVRRRSCPPDHRNRPLAGRAARRRAGCRPGRRRAATAEGNCCPAVTWMCCCCTRPGRHRVDRRPDLVSGLGLRRHGWTTRCGPCRRPAGWPATDLKVALGLLNARHVAGDPALTMQLREGALEDWRAAARTRLAELRELHEERDRMLRRAGLPARTRPQGSPGRPAGRARHPGHRGRLGRLGSRAPGPGRLRVRSWTRGTSLHEITGRPSDRLVLEEHDEVARAARAAGRGRAAARARGCGPHRGLRGRSRLPPGRTGQLAGACGGASSNAARWPTAWSSRTARWCWPGPPTPPPIRS